MKPLADQLDAFAGRLTAAREPEHIEATTTELMELARQLRAQEPAALALQAAAHVHQAYVAALQSAEETGTPLTAGDHLRFANAQGLASIAATLAGSPQMTPAAADGSVPLPAGVADGGLAHHLIDALEARNPARESPTACLSAGLLEWFTQVRA